MKKITTIVPCYNEEEVLPLFYARMGEVSRALPEAEFEMLFVNDGSSDGTLALLRKFSAQDPRVRYVSFSRNFGKEAGILAGLRAATGDYVALLDADLQDPPEYLIDMFHTLEQGEYDCVNLYRTTRTGEGRVRSFLSNSFYKLMGRLSNTSMMPGARDYRMMTRQVVECILSMPEYNRFTKGIFGWVGFQTKWIGYENVERAAGRTKFSMRGLFRYSVDGITSFSATPLKFASFLGAICCLVSVLIALFFVIKTIIWGDPVAGFPTLACLILLLGGMQLLCIGVLGEYLAKSYMESKRRPLYFVKETEKDGCTETDR